MLLGSVLQTIEDYRMYYHLYIGTRNKKLLPWHGLCSADNNDISNTTEHTTMHVSQLYIQCRDYNIIGT